MKIVQHLSSRKFFSKRFSTQKGQTLLEASLVIVLLSLILFGMLQVALVIQANQVQQWATFAGARCRVVGYNDTGVRKVYLVSNVLNSGLMLNPTPGLSSVAQAGIEPDLFLSFFGQAQSAYELAPQLEYESWERMSDLPPYTTFPTYTATSEKQHPLRIMESMPILSAALGGITNIQLEATVTLENHFPLYLDAN